MPLGDFRERLGQAMLSQDEARPPLPEEPSPEELQAYLGFRYVLLAPLFGIRLETLEVHTDTTDVTITADGHRLTVPVPTLRELVRERVRSEMARVRSPSPFAIDLNIVPRARAAADAGDHAQVAELLGSWPGPLSVLLRTAEGQSLTPEVRGTLASALAMLGSAYVELDRHDWAQEVLRLGIQWGQERIDVSADLFLRLGRAYVAEGRYAEAIGLMRRAVGLGAPRSEALPVLAECFLMRDHHLPAILCAEEAIAAGAEPKTVRSVRERAREHLGTAWERFRTRVGS